MRIESEQRTRESERETSRRQLLAEVARLEGERTQASAAIGRFTHETERRLVRAPVSGRVGEARVIQPGAYVRAGEVLGAILPTGSLRIVAEFKPSALGRIREGQAARLRLQGFPWAEYGSLAAVVMSVAREIRDGRVRVELGLVDGAASGVPLQHGLPGSVEVEVERVTPASLAFRAAGDTLSALAAPSGDRSAR